MMKPHSPFRCLLTRAFPRSVPREIVLCQNNSLAATQKETQFICWTIS